MKFRDKKKEMANKYKFAIYAIAEANGVNVGVAQDMLEANLENGGNYPYVNVAEFHKDYEELLHPTEEEIPQEIKE